MVFVPYLNFTCSRHFILFITGVDEAGDDTGDDILDAEEIGEISGADKRSGLPGTDHIGHVDDVTEITDVFDSVEESRTNVALNNTTSFSSSPSIATKPTPQKRNFLVPPNNINAREKFFSLHPIQPYAGVSFNPHRLYFRYDEGGKIERRWVTYSEEEEKYTVQFV